MASIRAMTEGNPARRRSFTSADRMLPPEPSMSTDDVSYRPGSVSSASASGRPMESPTMVNMVTCSRATTSRTVPASIWRVGCSTVHPPLSMAPHADQWPLACMSGPSEYETKTAGNSTSASARAFRRGCTGEAAFAATSSGRSTWTPGVMVAKKMSSWRQTTPFGLPVVPPVYTMYASSPDRVGKSEAGACAATRSSYVSASGSADAPSVPSSTTITWAKRGSRSRREATTGAKVDSSTSATRSALANR